MLKHKLIFPATMTACLCLLGCAAVPKARITNVDSYTVAEAIHDYGNTRMVERSFLGDMFGTVIVMGLAPFALGDHLEYIEDPNNALIPRHVWPAPAVIHNNQKMTVKYDLSKGSFDTYRCKDTITLIVQDPNDTVLSVKCQEKGIDFITGVITQWITPYKRDHERENMLMIKTTEQLQAEHQARIEWLGKWRPDPNSL